MVQPRGTPLDRTEPAARAPLLIHIGYHKTGTTWLQTGLFSDGSRGFTRPWTSQVIRAALVLPTAFEFDPGQARRVFEPELAGAAERALVPVLSDERLSGSPHAGGYDSALIADRLAQVFPEARVLAVIREQKEAIYSTYQQYVRDGGAASLEKYLAPRNPAEVPQFRFSHYEYHHLIAHYRKRFGADQVLALPFEWLRSDPGRFLDAISGFSGVPAGGSPPTGRQYPSMSALVIALKRWANRWLVRNALNPAAPLYVKDHERRFERLERAVPGWLSRPLERRSRAHIARVVGDRYGASNAATSALVGVDLAALGYAVAPASCLSKKADDRLSARA